MGENISATVGSIFLDTTGRWFASSPSSSEPRRSIDFEERAVDNPSSCEPVNFYYFILNCFVEAGEQCEFAVPPLFSLTNSSQGFHWSQTFPGTPLPGLASTR